MRIRYTRLHLLQRILNPIPKILAVRVKYTLHLTNQKAQLLNKTNTSPIKLQQEPIHPRVHSMRQEHVADQAHLTTR